MLGYSSNESWIQVVYALKSAVTEEVVVEEVVVASSGSRVNGSDWVGTRDTMISGTGPGGGDVNGDLGLDGR